MRSITHAYLYLFAIDFVMNIIKTYQKYVSMIHQYLHTNTKSIVVRTVWMLCYSGAVPVERKMCFPI